MTRKEFHEEIGRAMRRNDESDVPGVSEAAKAWRSAVTEPLKKGAIDVGLLPADVDVKTADSYFSRMWSRPKLEAGENDFKQIVRDWLDGSVTAAEEAEARKTEQARGQPDPRARGHRTWHSAPR